MSEKYEIMIAAAQELASKCKACKFCTVDCSFLRENGMPNVIAQGVMDGTIDPALAMECSLCGLCTQVCTVRGLDPYALFQAMRDVAVEANPALLAPYKVLLNYEKLGLSKSFSFFGVPEGATTLLFPGCNMPGARSDTVWDCFLKLREADPKLGLVLHCCAKPSKMLGKIEEHEERMASVVERIAATGVSEVLVMCPNCLVTLRSAKPPFAVRTVYEVLAERIPEPEPGMERIRTGVHDPCVLRAERKVHEAVRTILWNTGSSVAEMKHSMHKALCCGEGGGVKFVKPEYADAWRELRQSEASERRVVTYCAGCARQLGPEINAVHVLDLALGREAAPVSEWPGSSKSYLARTLLKRKARAFFRKQG
ncbi:MAG: (Fe-S)-binding protein [Proteobacteria bacterium]|nr:(Fe-S)-binding protein [Pseudomonadota bacterium]MBU1610889.1 (Fe-S)-binding protein [Pseudomonadota bacterium]